MSAGRARVFVLPIESESRASRPASGPRPQHPTQGGVTLDEVRAARATLTSEPAGTAALSSLERLLVRELVDVARVGEMRANLLALSAEGLTDRYRDEARAEAGRLHAASRRIRLAAGEITLDLWSHHDRGREDV